MKDKMFFYKIRNKAKTPILLFNILLEVIDNKGREIKGILIRKKEIGLPTYRWHECLHRKSQGIYKKASSNTMSVSKGIGYKINWLYKNQSHSYVLEVNIKIKNIILITIIKENPNT